MTIWIAIAFAMIAIVLFTIVTPQSWFPAWLAGPLNFVCIIGLLVDSVFTPVFFWGRRRLVSLAPLGIAFVGIWLADAYLPSRLRLSLPSSATEIQEYYREWGNGDYTRILKARLPIEDYQRFANRLRFDGKYAITNGIPPTRSRFPIVGGPPWWNPPDDPELANFKDDPRHDSATSIRYKDGWVYYLSVSW